MVSQFGWLLGTGRLLLRILWPVLLLAGCVTVNLGPGAGSAAPATHWVASWGTAQLVPDTAQAAAVATWPGATVRQVVRVSLGGQKLRVRVSNALGTTPLQLTAATVARAAQAGRPAVDAASLRVLRFDGRASVTIPAGAEWVSDPVELEHAAFTDLAVSLRLQALPQPLSSHPGSRGTSFIATGAREADAEWPDAKPFIGWHQLAAVDVLAPTAARAVVLIGDSIIDGYGVVPDSYGRWSDHLARRLAARSGGGVGVEASAPRAVVNAGIGGNHLLTVGLGPSLAQRFERDVLARAGVSHAIVHIGVNDLGRLRRSGQDDAAARAQLLAHMTLALRQIADAAAARGVCLIGATVMPFTGSDYYKPNADTESDRLALNAFIRGSGVFRAVIDFDAALRDPAQPERLLPAWDSGDHLHPSMAGYRAMAEAVPLALLDGCPAR